VDRRGGDEGVDATGGRFFQRLAGPVDVGVGGAGQPADHAVLDRARHRPHRFEIAGLAMGKPASITSTRIRSSILAMRTFSSLVIDAPGLCSPSRKVVSKMINWVHAKVSNREWPRYF
jgi:hypothetical protein